MLKRKWRNERMKKIGIIGLACLTAGIGLAGCAGSNSQPETTTTAETTTAAETTTTTAETTTTTQETTTTAEAPVYDNDNPPAAYKEVVDKLYKNIKNQRESNEAYGGGYVLGNSGHSGDEVVSYSVHDLNNDDIPELFIISENSNYIYEIYTLSVDKAILLGGGGYRAYMWIDEDGYVCQNLNGGARSNHLSKRSIPKNGTELALIELVEEEWGDCNKTTPAEGYDPVTAPDKLYTETITQEEFDAYNSSFHNYNKEFPFPSVPLRAFDTDSGIVAASDSAEDDVFMDYLRQYYNTHDTSAGTPSPDEYGHYTKYAIADFDADGENELAVQYDGLMGGEYPISNLFIYKQNNCNFDDFETLYASIGYKKFSEVTFLDNGVVYSAISDDIKKYYPNTEYLENKQYQILSNKMYEKLNYSLDNLRTSYGNNVDHSLILQYKKENNIITKSLGAQEELFSVEKTQEQYEADMAIINGGKELDFQIKDFTAENIGL